MQQIHDLGAPMKPLILVAMLVAIPLTANARTKAQENHFNAVAKEAAALDLQKCEINDGTQGWTFPNKEPVGDLPIYRCIAEDLLAGKYASFMQMPDGSMRKELVELCTFEERSTKCETVLVDRPESRTGDLAKYGVTERQFAPIDCENASIATQSVPTCKEPRAKHLPVHGGAKTPQAAAEAFYRWVLANPDGGLPSPAQRKQLAWLLTPDFSRLLAATSNAESQCVAATPAGYKPPIFEGSLFVGSYEGASEVWFSEPRVAGREAIIDVNLLWIGIHHAKGDKHRTYAWRDSVKLRKEKRGWLVADVIVEESLTAILRKYVNEVGTACLLRLLGRKQP